MDDDVWRVLRAAVQYVTARENKHTQATKTERYRELREAVEEISERRAIHASAS